MELKVILNKYLKNNYFVLFFLAMLLFSSFFVFSLHIRKEAGAKISLVILSDIHAGSQDERIDSLDPANIIYPVNFERNLGGILEKTGPEETIIALGDNLNQNSDKYASRLNGMMRGRDVIWVKGNHDKKEIFENFFNKKTYYSTDRGNWKIIVLDNGGYIQGSGEGFDNRGRIDEEQIDWLEKELRTDKKVIVAMHVSIFEENNPEKVRADQEPIRKIFEENNNVRYVLAGHFHSVYLEKEMNGTKYITVPSISKKGQEEFFSKLELE
jgi:3',5'-cyclic AMP phosphodiesterase CpdA